MQGPQAAWLALASAKGFTPRLIQQLYQAFGSIERLFCASDRELDQLGLAPAKRRQLRQLQLNGEALFAPVATWLTADASHHLLCLDDPRYPPQLRQLDDPPPLLYVQGDPELLSFPQIAMVGSRKASVQGERDAVAFARALSDAGLIPTSGLALGIDARAHEGALQGRGFTVAVLGSGIDQIYPARNRPLAARILAEGGTLVSEFPLGTPPLPAYFPQRNRIISGLSRAVLVVEAALKSGSLITARLALEQGREVFALPGSIHNPASRGCHQLIRQGAVLVETLEHILAELGPQLDAVEPAALSAAAPLPLLPANADSAAVLHATGYEPTALDQVIARSGLAAAEVQAELLGLELQGLVLAVQGGYQRC